MAYWLDDGFDRWPQVVRAGSAAVGLYVRCGAWISGGIYDGTITEPVVPAEIATMYGTPEWVAKLVAAGLWSTDEAGYRDVCYHQMGNPTAEVVSKKKADAAERQRRWRERAHQKKKDEARESRVSNASHNALRNGLGDAYPSLPPSKEGKGGAPAPLGAAHPPNTQPQHPDDDRLVDWDDPLARAEREEELRLASEQAVRDRQEAMDRARRGREAAMAAAGLDKPKHAAPDPVPPPEPPAWDGTTRQMPFVNTGGTS